MKFVRRAVEDGEDDADDVGVARKERKADLVAHRTLSKETEDAVVDEVYELRPPPELHLRKIFGRNRAAYEYEKHPEKHRKQVLHAISVQISLFSLNIPAPVEIFHQYNAYAAELQCAGLRTSTEGDLAEASNGLLTFPFEDGCNRIHACLTGRHARDDDGSASVGGERHACR